MPELRSQGVRIPLQFDELNKTLSWLWNDQILSSIYSVYHRSDYNNADDLFVAATTDRTFTCPTRRALTAASMAGNDNIYAYHFTYRPSSLLPWDTKKLGVYHTFDLQYVIPYHLLS